MKEGYRGFKRHNVFLYGNNKSRLGYDGHSLVRYPHYGVAGEIPVKKKYTH